MSDDNGSWSWADLEAMAAIPDVPAVSDVQLAHLAAIRFPVGSDAEMIRSTASELQQRRAALPTLEGRALADLGAQVAALRDALTAKDARIAELEAEMARLNIEACTCRYRSVNGDIRVSRECASHKHLRETYNTLVERNRDLNARAEQAEAERRDIGGQLYAATERVKALLTTIDIERTGRKEAEADNARLRAALERIDRDGDCECPSFCATCEAHAVLGGCPACHGTGTSGERRADGAPLVCTECGR